MRTCDTSGTVSSGSGRTAACLTGRHPAARGLCFLRAAFTPSSMNRPPTIPAQHPARNRAVFRAALCEEYLRLRDEGRFTVTGAARALGRSASSFSGKGSMLHRYLRGGIAGLTRRGRGAAASDLSEQIEALGWFVPAAQFFYLSAHRRQGALVGAFRSAAALPSLPIGWRRATRARFLARLNLEAPPACPANLREAMAIREREGKPLAPARIERLVKSTPADIRRHCVEAPVEDLARVPFAAITNRLAELQPGGNCRLTIELL